MTNEEARLTLQDNFGYLSQEHPRILEALRVAIEALSKPSLPSNIDEAAHNYDMANNSYEEFDGELEKAFKAGAELVAGQFQEIDGDLVDWYETNDGKYYCCGVKTNDAFEVPEGFYIKKK